MAPQIDFQPYQLPVNSNMPQQYNQDFFNQLQGTLGNEYQNQVNNLGNFQQSHNLQPVDENFLSQVIGSPQQDIESQIFPTALNASSVGASQDFQRQLQSLQLQQQLQYMDKAAQYQQELINLQHQLMPHGYKPSFGQELTQGIASELGGGTVGFGQGAANAAFMGG